MTRASDVSAARVYVTGIGIVSAIGIGHAAYWHSLTTGATGISYDRSLRGVHPFGLIARATPVRVAQYVPDAKVKRLCSRTFELLMIAAKLARDDAGYGDAALGSRAGTVVGVGAIDQYTEDLMKCEGTGSILREMPHAEDDIAVGLLTRLYPLRRLQHLPNVGGSLVAIAAGARGPNLTLVTGITAGLQALQAGCDMIRDGRADVVVCGGVDARLSVVPLSVASTRHSVSASEDADRACRPFDRARSGIVPGEGAVIMVLESEDNAIARGSRCYAQVLRGASHYSTGDDAIKRVLAVEAHPDLVVAHGEGSAESDDKEANALCAAFAPAQVKVITSIQGAVGHTFCAAGAFAAATGCLSLFRQCVPPIRNLTDPIADLPFATSLQAANLENAVVYVIDPFGGAASLLLARS